VQGFLQRRANGRQIEQLLSCGRRMAQRRQA
jgi:hypothetical protein